MREKTPDVGDAVMWSGELFRLDAIYEDDEGTWATIINTGGEEDVYLDELEYVAKDTLTGVGGKALFDTTTRYSEWSTPPPVVYRKKYVKKRPAQRDSISTAGLIKDEVTRLKDDEEDDKSGQIIPIQGKYEPNQVPLTSTPRKLRSSAPSKKPNKSEDKEEQKPIGGLPRRKGDW
jgi:hypothetical protein